MPWKEAKPTGSKATPSIKPNAVQDILKSLRTGTMQGMAGLAGSVAETRIAPKMLDTAVSMADNAENLIRAIQGQSLKKNTPFQSANMPGLKTALAGAPATEDMNRFAQTVDGKYHTPQTTPGRYAQSIAQMAPALAAPGSLPARVANTVLPGIGGQAGADIAKNMGGGETAQNLARLGGSLAGGTLAQVRTPSLQQLGPAPVRDPATMTPEQRNVQILKDAGVFMTPGQKAGGALKNAEDLAARAPILGAAIKGARGRSNESLVRSVGHTALEPFGEGVPANIHTGHDSVAYVARRLGKAYDDAAAMVPETQLGAPYADAKVSIKQALTEHPESVSRQFDAIVENRLAHLEGGPVSGQQIRSAQEALGKKAAELGAHDDPDQRALGAALDELNTTLGDAIGAASPEAADLIGKANQGWAVYSRMRNAASKAKGGKFTTGQLATAVRTLDKSVGKGNVAKGQAVLQDLSNAAWEVLPDSYGNPGTADALSAFALGGAAVNPTTAPVAIPTAGVLGAASIPYAMMGRKPTTSLPPQGSSADPRQVEEFIRMLQATSLKMPEVLAMPNRQTAPRR